MMMESVPVSLKTNWKAPGRKSQTETKGHEQITDEVRCNCIKLYINGQVAILVASHHYSLL